VCRYPAVFGACFFFWPAVWLMVIENANTDLEMRRHNWRVHGEKGRKPGYVPAVPCCALLCPAVPCCALPMYKLSRRIPDMYQLMPMCSALIMACQLIATSCCGHCQSSAHQSWSVCHGSVCHGSVLDLHHWMQWEETSSAGSACPTIQQQ